MRKFTGALVVALGIGLLAMGCNREPTATDNGGKRVIKLGMVAKSQDNAVFQAAHAGARAACQRLGEKYNAVIELDIKTPPSEDAVKQAEAVDALVRSGVQGIAVSCSDAGPLTPAINRAVDAGVAVMCFDSDAPKSKRFAYYGTDDQVCGEKVMSELAKAMGDSGVVAILAGNASAPNLQARVKGVRDELARHPNIKLVSAGGGVFNHAENPSESAEAWKNAHRTNPEITGWALVGGWPLFVKGAVDWDPSKVKVVAVDALPAQIDYLENDSVDMLLAQDCYGWGGKSVEILLEKIVNNKEPENVKVIDPLTPVTKANAAEFRKNWDQWLGK